MVPPGLVTNTGVDLEAVGTNEPFPGRVVFPCFLADSLRGILTCCPSAIDEIAGNDDEIRLFLGDTAQYEVQGFLLIGHGIGSIRVEKIRDADETPG